MTVATDLLVIGAGPYGLSTAAWARERGIDTTVLGQSMAFWRDNMPEGMFLRSGPDWHLDAGGVHTLEAHLEEQGIAPEDVDPLPIAVFLDYCERFRQAKGIDPRPELVDTLEERDGRFEATMAGGERIVADAVVCAPGNRHYAHLPDWAASVPPGRATHTCDLVRFDALAGARVLIVGGRQSAYEWAALLREHGAERVDVSHRHEVPRFDRVSWKFVDPHVQQTIDVPGYWRNLSRAEQEAIALQFWEVGRLTLEYWLAPRLEWDGLHLRPHTEVVEIATAAGDAIEVALSDGERLTVDHIVFASGYKPDLTRVPYLAGVVGEIDQNDGFPVLDESFGTSVRGLYLTGFSATQDFGPFFGFVKGSPAAATLVVRDLESRT
jgi:cation diffusion facilitator CzcD-associated flavoprotein CzcO